MSKMVQARINALEIENAELRRQLEDRPSLRDQFAMAALQMDIWCDIEMRGIANKAYEMANAMMEARDVCD